LRLFFLFESFLRPLPRNQFDEIKLAWQIGPLIPAVLTPAAGRLRVEAEVDDLGCIYLLIFRLEDGEVDSLLRGNRLAYVDCLLPEKHLLALTSFLLLIYLLGSLVLALANGCVVLPHFGLVSHLAFLD
jgi:hypothetical protein